MAKAGRERARTVCSLAIAVAVSIPLLFSATTAIAREKSAREPEPAAKPAEPSGPLIVVVSIKEQKVHVYDANGEVTSSRVSTGRPGFDTPTGVFSILEKNVHHESNLYSGAEMPYMQRITWSGVALHAGVVPGYRASHGCIRLPYSFSKKLFDITKVGNRVIVSGNEVAPVAFDHPKLFRPLPLDEASALRSGRAGQQQIAVNDQGVDPAATDAMQDVPRFIGISPALIRAVAAMQRDPGRRPTTRVEAERMAKERGARLQAALKTAMSATTANADKAKAANKEFDALSGRLEQAKRDVEPLRAAVRSAERKLQDALRAFEDFMSGGMQAAARSGDAQYREGDLEDAILDAAIDADGARAAAAKSEMSFAEVQATYSAAKATHDAALDASKQAQADLRSAETALAANNKEMALRAKPISVLVSLRAQRIYIRQGINPLLEAPITVAPVSNRLGTHVFTAMRYASDPNKLDWQLVSAQTPAPGQPFDEAKKRRSRELPSSKSHALNVEMATAALNAFTIPDEISQTITELARPGSSLIVSDRELPPNENGGGTEFVVLTR